MWMVAFFPFPFIAFFYCNDIDSLIFTALLLLGLVLMLVQANGMTPDPRALCAVLCAASIFFFLFEVSI